VNIVLSLLCAFPLAIDAWDVRDIGPVFFFLSDHDDGIFSSHLHAVLVSQKPLLRHPLRFTNFSGHFDASRILQRWKFPHFTNCLLPHASRLTPFAHIDRRYLDGLEKSGFFDKPRTGK
jgi:hypothetical protein